MQKISADYIFTGSGTFIKEGIIKVDNEGKILEVSTDAGERSDSIVYEGIICPGFVNAHCHLELSHLKGKIEPGTGLTGFIKDLVEQRQAPEEESFAAMEQADADMSANGIVAVGDISNSVLSFHIKKNSRIHYHTFIELLGLNPASAPDILERGLQMLELAGPDASLTVHAPYSISAELLQQTARHTDSAFLSIHTQESPEEDLFLMDKKGRFPELYHRLGIETDLYIPPGKNSVSFLMDHLPEKKKVLFVHNTYIKNTGKKLAENHTDAWWCLCPNANLYIEKRLPDIHLFIRDKERVVLGTDSLASNQGLSILDEMKTLHACFPQIPLETLLQWGTFNGAVFLEVDQNLGSIEAGKKPGLNLVYEIDMDHMRVTPDTKVRGIV